ncbi:hypothetical protein FGIG_09462 [Fasciola gigantica]|uniref:Secreted protein n=1 Tax=Fasciola gigantica TaxID=46835 RepID=A0A504YJ85_FASGI|nr:hypothetical protein FGIG_09462 [Fasciola gigantica]
MKTIVTCLYFLIFLDASIKAQLGSLDYVRKICTARLQQIKEGITEKMKIPVSLVVATPYPKLLCFTDRDYLTSVDKHPLLRLYLNCVVRFSLQDRFVTCVHVRQLCICSVLIVGSLTYRLPAVCIRSFV